MAQPDPLDEALERLAQAFADLGTVVSIIRQLRQNGLRLQPMLADELRGHIVLLRDTIALL
jgi:hypothetical protein